MHEYPVTEEIVRIACKTAAEKDAAVHKVTLVVGEDSGFVGESLQMYFDVLAEGTPCEGAKLEIKGVRPQLSCRKCGRHFIRKPFSFDCPYCGGEGEPTSIGKEFYIESLELEVKD